MSISHPVEPAAFRDMVLNALSALSRLLARFSSGRRLSRRQSARCHSAHRNQHFGSLDDQLLDDLGLQRSAIRAAELGVLPGDQALHRAVPEDPADARRRRQARA